MRNDYGNWPCITVSCLEPKGCVIYFEPWGSHHQLQRSESFTVYSLAIATNDLEVSYVADGISLMFATGADYVVIDSSGKELPT